MERIGSLSASLAGRRSALGRHHALQRLIMTYLFTVGHAVCLDKALPSPDAAVALYGRAAVSPRARRSRLSQLSIQHAHGSDFTVRVRAGQAAADADVRTWVSALVTALGRHSSVVVFDAAGEQIANCTHPDTDPGQH